jgi:hypothetical protein
MNALHAQEFLFCFQQHTRSFVTNNAKISNFSLKNSGEERAVSVEQFKLQIYICVLLAYCQFFTVNSASDFRFNFAFGVIFRLLVTYFWVSGLCCVTLWFLILQDRLMVIVAFQGVHVDWLSSEFVWLLGSLCVLRVLLCENGAEFVSIFPEINYLAYLQRQTTPEVIHVLPCLYQSLSSPYIFMPLILLDDIIICSWCSVFKQTTNQKYFLSTWSMIMTLFRYLI